MAPKNKYVKLTLSGTPDRILNEREGGTAIYQIVARSGGKTNLEAWKCAKAELAGVELPAALQFTAYKENKQGNMNPVATMTATQITAGLDIVTRYEETMAQAEAIKAELESLRTRFVMAAQVVSAKGLANVIQAYAAEPASEPPAETPAAEPASDSAPAAARTSRK